MQFPGTSNRSHPKDHDADDARGIRHREFQPSVRTKRSMQARSALLCRLTFIADYSFFKNVGDADKTKTIRLIVSLFYRLNALFESSNFLLDTPFRNSGYGFLLADIIVHEAWNSELGHYNAPTDVGGNVWSPHALSTAFNFAILTNSCLAHLLTYRPFKGILGRAWMAGSQLGGICSAPAKRGNREFHTNTGWTTYSSYNGHRLPNMVAELIVAHELGHNWGAAHDPDTPECNPPAKSYGKYLMYAHSVSGFSENNYRFSPCSKRTIGATLITRAPICFVKASESSTQCGNGRLDPGEECDVGGTTDSSCCISDCRLRSGAQCDPWNHGCCTNDCYIAPETALCTDKHEDNPCLLAGRCNGTSAWCPGPTLLSGVPCADHGQCLLGHCQSHCSRQGLNTCICDDVNYSCYICCLFPQPNHRSFVCKPVTIPYASGSLSHDDPARYSFVSTSAISSISSNRTRGGDDHFIRNIILTTGYVFLHLDDYRPCATGYCMSGKCHEFKQPSILRFWQSSDKSKDDYFASVASDEEGS